MANYRLNLYFNTEHMHLTAIHRFKGQMTQTYSSRLPFVLSRVHNVYIMNSWYYVTAVVSRHLNVTTDCIIFITCHVTQILSTLLGSMCMYVPDFTMNSQTRHQLYMCGKLQYCTINGSQLTFRPSHLYIPRRKQYRCMEINIKSVAKPKLKYLFSIILLMVPDPLAIGAKMQQSRSIWFHAATRRLVQGWRLSINSHCQILALTIQPISATSVMRFENNAYSLHYFQNAKFHLWQ